MGHGHREVPGCDGSADAQGIPVDDGVDIPCLDLLGLESLRDLLQLGLDARSDAPGFSEGLSDRLPHFPGDEVGELLRPFHESRSRSGEKFGPFPDFKVTPGGLSPSGPSHDAGHLPWRGHLHGAYDFAVQWIV